MSKEMKVLLVESNDYDSRMIQDILPHSRMGNFKILRAATLSECLVKLELEEFDVVILDLNLSDSIGIDTLMKIRYQYQNVPVVVLAAKDDVELALKAVKLGAQDFLVKGELHFDPLGRVIRYAIERQNMIIQLRNLALIDDLTGLYNRRGFLLLAEQQQKLMQRSDTGLSLLFIDLDGMKYINDTFGHHEGDQALKDIAEILRKSFRKSDIIARIGGDEFVILAINTDKESNDLLVYRIEENIINHNSKSDKGYNLSVSIGLTYSDSNAPFSINEMLAQADVLMYEHKRSKS